MATVTGSSFSDSGFHMGNAVDCKTEIASTENYSKTWSFSVHQIVTWQTWKNVKKKEMLTNISLKEMTADPNPNPNPDRKLKTWAEKNILSFSQFSVYFSVFMWHLCPTVCWYRTGWRLYWFYSTCAIVNLRLKIVKNSNNLNPNPNWNRCEPKSEQKFPESESESESDPLPKNFDHPCSYKYRQEHLFFIHSNLRSIRKIFKNLT